MEPERKFVQLAGGAIKTKVMTAGVGSPVVYLHGPYGLTWEPWLDRLATKFAVHAPEHPGSGESEGLEQLDNIWDLVLYYYDLFDALDLQSPAVVGHSFGGMVGAELAACNPERVSRLVLVNALGLWIEENPVADYVGMRRSAVAEKMFVEPEGPAARQVLAVPEENSEMARFMTRETWALASTAHFIWPIPDKGLRKRASRIKAPTLIIWGIEDRVASPAYADEFARLIPESKVELIQGAAHMPNLEQSDSFYELVSEFLSE